MQAHILIISNPISGDGTGPVLIREQIEPALAGLQYEVHQTTHPGSAGEVALSFLERHSDSSKPIVFIVSGGDGTLHEVVNGIGMPTRPIQVVLCPHGTANALYSTLFPTKSSSSADYRLQSFQAFLEGRTKPLSVTRTEISNGEGEVVQSCLGVVVASTSLHAAILDAAEHLRQKIPSLERFKVAAMENISNWYHSEVVLEKPAIYRPDSKTFTSLATDEAVSGPFAYFLSTVNVDRLEPTFIISPLFSQKPPTTGEIDLVVVRPLRQPSLRSDTQEARKAFAPVLINVLQSAYLEGSHISLKYEPDSDTDDPYIVEYLRCGGWKWRPVRFLLS